MGLIIPPSVNFPSPIVALPTKWNNPAPAEGPQLIPLEIDWANMGGAQNCVTVNLQSNPAGQNTFTQIVAIKVDNSLCGGDIRIMFPDTQDTVTIPAYTPTCIVPVFTRSNIFYVQNLMEESIDVTRIILFNTMPPPVAVPTTQEQNAVSSTGINMDVVANTQLIPATVSGTIEGINLYTMIVGGGTAGHSATWVLQDGTGKNLIAGQVMDPAAANITNYVPGWSGLNLRFSGGVQFQVTASNIAVTCTSICELTYRTP